MEDEEYDPVAIFPNDEDGLMFYWKAHFDASGKYPLLVVAGVLSCRPEWKLFNQAWRAPLTNERGHTDIFHATDFEAGQGDFTEEKGWSSQRRDAARLRLVDTLQGLSYGVVCSVVVPDYDEIIVGWHRNELGDAYNFCVNGCIKMAGYWLQEQGISDPFSAIVEAGDEGQGEVQKTFLRFFNDRGAREFFRLGTLALLPKSGAIGLQAADMLAHYFADWLSGTQPLVEPYARVINAANVEHEHYDKEKFRGLIEKDREGVQVQYREALWSYKTPRTVDVNIKADFDEADRVLTELEALMETHPEAVHSLIKDAPSVYKLFGIEMKDDLTSGAGHFSVCLKPKEYALKSVAAIRALEGNRELSE